MRSSPGRVTAAGCALSCCLAGLTKVLPLGLSLCSRGAFLLMPGPILAPSRLVLCLLLHPATAQHCPAQGRINRRRSSPKRVPWHNRGDGDGTGAVSGTGAFGGSLPPHTDAGSILGSTAAGFIQGSPLLCCVLEPRGVPVDIHARAIPRPFYSSPFFFFPLTF